MAPSVFVEQLTELAQTSIEQSRSPFRRAEAKPQLLTAQGVLHPQLVLWINRESFMAAGVILYVEDTLPKTLEQGRACADALGLRHFLTLAGNQIDIWEVAGDSARHLESLHLPDKDQPQSAELLWVMQQILDKLKPLAVLGAVPPEHLSPHYLANLCRSPLRITRGELEETFRRARVEASGETGKSVLQQASIKGTLVLVRLLALLSFNQIPAAVQPDKLEMALALALPQLPDPLALALQPFAGEVPLPHASAVRFHHLFRRLGQLGWAADRVRAAQTLDILLRYRCHLLGLPYDEAPPDVPKGTLCINPTHAGQSAPLGHEIFQDAGLRALLSLSRELQGLPHPPSECIELAQMVPREPWMDISAALMAEYQVPGSVEKQMLRLCLRHSWPNRRLYFPPKTPRWVWDAIHLLGLAGEGASLGLDLPDQWLELDASAPLVELFIEQFSLLEYERHFSGRARLLLKKVPDPRCLAIRQAEPLYLMEATSTTPREERNRLQSALSCWLGAYGDNPVAEENETLVAEPDPRERRIRPQDTEQIAAAVFRDGLPRFPEQYLYDHYRPDLEEFSVPGPLRIQSSLLGTYELCDETGYRLKVQGEETAQALVLASYSHTGRIGLPRDRRLTLEILTRYLADLQELRRKLLLQTHSRRDKSQAARLWAKKIWDAHPLPPWDQIPE